LLLHANRVLSRDRLIDELWGAQPPPTAVTSLQVYVSRLRKLLPPETLLTRPPGYLLAVDPNDLDLQRFEHLLKQGHEALADGDAGQAARVLHEALTLWRGPALAEFAFEPFAQNEIARLEDLRLGAVEERIEADLALGRHADVIGELEALVRESPHRERLRGQLILALYRSGRQADALDAYQQARRALDELGIEPSAELQELEKAILTHDPALSVKARRELPSGTVTYLFTDVEESTRLMQQLGDRYVTLLEEHRNLLRGVFEAHGGVEVDTQGDAFFVAFGSARGAVGAAQAVQDRLTEPLRIRIGLHTGEAQLTGGGYVGIDVNRAARIAAAAHGGQVLLSQSTRDLVDADVRDLGVHRLKGLPSPERLYQLGLGEFPPIRTIAHTNLPLQPTPLVGRERELVEVMGLVQANRLVTLTGAGGSGKTRLALHAAAQLVDDFPHGVWFVSLASLTDPELVETTIAQALGARGELTHFLRGKQPLLLLDNLEQLLPGVAAIVARLDVKVLTTSRERLNVTAEHEYPVPPLPLDDAVALFTQRARQLKPRFEPDEHVTEIARRLDGLPLALELTAARVKVLAPAQIVERLGESLDLVSGGGHDRPERHRTLRATLEWSYGLLSNDEQRLFARLGIFAADFDLRIAETVAGAALDPVQSLVDRSLLQPASEGRFRMLETVRAFAREFLEPTDLEELRRAQFQLVGDVANRAKEGRSSWYRAVRLLLPDIREVLNWMLEREPSQAARVICALRPFWAVPGRVREARVWLERLLVHRAALADDVLAETLLVLGWTRLRTDEPDAAAEPLRESIALYSRFGDRSMEATATHMYAHLFSARGANAEALALRERTLVAFREAGDQEMVCRALHHIGVELRNLGKSDEARRMFEEAIALAPEQSYPFVLANALTSLAYLELESRNLDNAQRLYHRALETSRSVEPQYEDADCIAGLACVAGLRGETELAGQLWRRAERIEEETSERILHRDRERYEEILAPLKDDPLFRRGCDSLRTAPQVVKR
jgi:predicted ATPase/DNA-binding SARP family transcriptional activator